MSLFFSQVKGLLFLRFKKIRNAPWKSNDSYARYALWPLFLFFFVGFFANLNTIYVPHDLPNNPGVKTSEAELQEAMTQALHSIRPKGEPSLPETHPLHSVAKMCAEDTHIGIINKQESPTDFDEYLRITYGEENQTDFFRHFNSKEDLLTSAKNKTRFCAAVLLTMDRQVEIYSNVLDHSGNPPSYHLRERNFRKYSSAYAEVQPLANLIAEYLLFKAQPPEAAHVSRFPLTRPIAQIPSRTRFAYHYKQSQDDPWLLFNPSEVNPHYQTPRLPWMLLVLTMVGTSYVSTAFEGRRSKMHVILLSHGLRYGPTLVANVIFHVICDYSPIALALTIPPYWQFKIKASALVFLLGYSFILAHIHALARVFANLTRSCGLSITLLSVLLYGSLGIEFLLKSGLASHISVISTAQCENDSVVLSFCLFASDSWWQVVYGVFSPFSLINLFQMAILGYENFPEQEGAGLSDVFNFWSTAETSGFSLNSIIMTSVFSTFFFHLLAIYLHELIPQDDGSGNARKFSYPIDDLVQWWRDRRRGGKYRRISGEGPVLLGRPREVLNVEEAPLMRCHQLYKRYADFWCTYNTQAVSNFSWDLSLDKIYTLLGVNGAGKSSTIAMISGQTFIDSGSVTLGDLEISKNRDAFLRKIGICFQENRSFDFLTVKEHLWLLNLFRGGESPPLGDHILETMNLNKDARISTLSGGQKRKFCLVLAYSQNTEGVVLLDEPTAGVDQASREKIWRVISDLRPDRVTLLTTHFMDEAEFLSDEIAIMKDGRIFTKGTPNELRRKFNSGFVLSVSSKGCPVSQLKHSIQTELSGDFVFESDSLLKFRVSYDKKENLLNFIMSTIKDQWEFSLELVSLGDVLQRVAEQGEPFTLEGSARSGGRDSSIPHQIAACCMKRLTQIRRNPFGFWYAFFFRFTFLLLLTCFLTTIAGKVFTFGQTLQSFTADAADLTPFVTKVDDENRLILVGDRYSTEPQTRFPIESDFSPYYMSLATFEHADPQMLRHPFKDRPGIDPIFLVVEENSPNMFDMLGSLWSNTKETGEVQELPPTLTYHLSINQPIDIFQADTNWLNFQLSQRKQPSWRFQYQALDAFMDRKYPEAKFAPGTPDFAKDLERVSAAFHRSEDHKYLYFLAVLVILSAQGLGIAALADDLPFCLEVTKVKGESDLREWQYMSGLSPAAYWLSHWLTDALTFGTSLSSLIFMGLWVSEFALLDPQVPSEVRHLFFKHSLLLPLASGPFTYFWHQLANTSRFSPRVQQASKWLLEVLKRFIFVSVMLYGTLVLLDPDPPNEVPWYVWSLKMVTFLVVRVNPVTGYLQALYCVGKAMMPSEPTFDPSSFDPEHPPSMFGEVKLDQKRCTWSSWTSPQWDAVLTLFSTLAYILILIWMDTHRLEPQYSKTREREYMSSQPREPAINLKLPQIYQQDQGVLEARAKVEDGVISEKNQEILLRKVHKVYMTENPVHAVRGASLGIGQAEVFGLLGANGAGKSSLFYMLTGLVSPSQGDVYIKGTNTRDRIALTDRRKDFGYTPQANLLLPNLTVSDHLKFFGRLRNCQDVHAEVAQKIRLLDLEEVESRLATHCSGGYKRRFLAALSFMSDPQILFLDEPLSGVDVLAANKFYQVLQAFAQGHAQKSTEDSAAPVIVLTTHRMVEAEEMCSRVGIMREGQFVVLGAIHQLVNRYCSGSEVRLIPTPVDADELDEAWQMFQQQFAGKDQTLDNLVEFSQLPANPSLGNLFQKVEAFRGIHPLTDTAALEVLGTASEIRKFDRFLKVLSAEAQVVSAHFRLDSLILISRLSVYELLVILRKSSIAPELQDYLVSSINISQVFQDISEDLPLDVDE